MIYPWLEKHWEFFTRRLEQGRLAHAVMISGPAGCGKLALAELMVNKLLCRGSLEFACGTCRSCKLLEGGAHPDRFNIQPEESGKDIKVDQVRALISSLDLTASISNRKVARIHPAENMNIASANALLKSLEEPAGETVLILVCSDPARLPVTIRSRCQVIPVSQPEKGVAMAWLASETGAIPQALQDALDAAGGSPLRAVRYLEQPDKNEFRQVRKALAGLLLRPASASLVGNGLTALGSDDLWRWISLCTAEAIRGNMTGRTTAWLPPDIKLQAARLFELQRQADINRKMATSPVRGDLLLSDWLIRWAEQVI